LKILVAEDEDIIMNTYQVALKSRNHEIFSATDGEECLKIFSDHFEKIRKTDTNSMAGHDKETPFDLVILDHRMPKKNGLEVAEQILLLAPSQRIVIASAYTHELKIQTNWEKMLELVQKPFGLDVLFSIVEKVPNLGITKYALRPSINDIGLVSRYDGNSTSIDQEINTASFDLEATWLRFNP